MACCYRTCCRAKKYKPTDESNNPELLNVQNALAELIPGDHISFKIRSQKHHAIVRNVVDENQFHIIHISGKKGDTITGFKSGISITLISLTSVKKVFKYIYDPDFMREDKRKPDNVALMIGEKAMPKAFKCLSCKQLCTYCITGETAVSNSKAHKNTAKSKKDLDALLFQIDKSIVRKKKQNHKTGAIQKREDALLTMNEQLESSEKKQIKTDDFDEIFAEIHKEKIFPATVSFTTHAREIDKDRTNVPQKLFKEISKADKPDSSVKMIYQHGLERETSDDINPDEFQSEKTAKMLTVIETVDTNTSVKTTLQLKNNHFSETGGAEEYYDETKMKKIVKDNADQRDFAAEVDLVCQKTKTFNIDRLEDELQMENIDVKTVACKIERTRPETYFGMTKVDVKTTGQFKMKSQNFEYYGMNPNKDDVRENEIIKDKNKVQEQLYNEKSNIVTIDSRETNMCQHEMESETTIEIETNRMESETCTQMTEIIGKINTKTLDKTQNENLYSETVEKINENGDKIENNLTANGYDFVQRNDIRNLNKLEGKLQTKRSSLVFVEIDEKITEAEVYRSRPEEKSQQKNNFPTPTRNKIEKTADQFESEHVEYSDSESTKNCKKEGSTNEAKQNKNNVQDQICDNQMNVCISDLKQYQHEIEKGRTNELSFVEKENKTHTEVKAIPKQVENNADVVSFQKCDEKQNNHQVMEAIHDTGDKTEMNELIDDVLQKTDNIIFKEVYPTLQIESSSKDMVTMNEQTTEATMDGSQLKKCSFPESDLTEDDTAEETIGKVIIKSKDGEEHKNGQSLSIVRNTICQSNEDKAKREEKEPGTIFRKEFSV